MPRWRSLPEDLDPQIREFANQLRRLVDRSGLSVAGIADRTGYSKSSWERYLSGRLLPPRGATQALAEVTGTDVRHLGTMWELAERAWSRSEMRHDTTLEAIRIAQARAALDVAEEAPTRSRRRRKDTSRPASGPAGTGASGPRVPGPRGRADGEAAAVPGAFPASPPPPGPGAPAADVSCARAPGTDVPGAGIPGTDVPGAGAPGVGAPGDGAGFPEREPGRPERGGGGRRKVTVLLAALVAVLVLVAGAVLFFDLGSGEKESAEPKPSPTTTARSLPAGVECAGKSCSGKDPEAMGCGGQHAATVSSARVGGTLVEVRYSDVCKAAWGRISSAQSHDALRITGPGGQRESDTVTSTNDAYTAMVSAPTDKDARACATPAAGGEGCTTPGRMAR